MKPFLELAKILAASLLGAVVGGLIAASATRDAAEVAAKASREAAFGAMELELDAREKAVHQETEETGRIAARLLVSQVVEVSPHLARAERSHSTASLERSALLEYWVPTDVFDRWTVEELRSLGPDSELTVNYASFLIYASAFNTHLVTVALRIGKARLEEGERNELEGKWKTMGEAYSALLRSVLNGAPLPSEVKQVAINL